MLLIVCLFPVALLGLVLAMAAFEERLDRAVDAQRQRHRRCKRV